MTKQRFILPGLMALAVLGFIAGCDDPPSSSTSDSALALCKQNEACWGERHRAQALAQCEPLLRQAIDPDSLIWWSANDQDKLPGVAFDDPDAGTLVYTDGTLELHKDNGEVVIYRGNCSYDPVADRVYAVSVEPLS